MHMIKCEDVSFSYNGNEVLKNLNFFIDEKDYLCILGENGAGKSTLVKGLLGLKEPSRGKVIKDNLKNNEIGYLPQNNSIQKDFPASVFEIVLSGCINKIGRKSFFNSEHKRLALEKIKKLGIEHLKNESYRYLSGGEKQRVLLARALCSTEKLIVLDEPVAALDHFITKELYSLIQKINKEENISIVMVSHDIYSALNYANKILYIKNQQLFFGTKEEYLNSDLFNTFKGGV